MGWVSSIPALEGQFYTGSLMFRGSQWRRWLGYAAVSRGERRSGYWPRLDDGVGTVQALDASAE